MDTITFEETLTAVDSAPQRADVACFVGLAAHVSGATFEAHWPLRLDRWSDFSKHLATADLRGGDTPLAVAVRSFFAQGGRRCHVVPIPDSTPRDKVLDALCPSDLSPSAADTWRGLGALFRVRDASLVSFPDLPSLFASVSSAVSAPLEAPRGPGVFVPESTAPTLRSPIPPRHSEWRATEDDYKAWSGFLQRVVAALKRHFRDVLCVAAVPRPADIAQARDDLHEFLFETRVKEDRRNRRLPRSAFLQLAWPWLRTPASASSIDGFESPEGTLVGLIARNALLRGTWQSAAAGVPHAIEDGLPIVGRAQGALAESVSVFGPTVTGWRLLSDVTTSDSRYWRDASVSRLMGAVLRCAAIAGEQVAFEANGEATWAFLRRRVEGVLRQMRARGALRGASEAESFSVRCDRSTMTESDLDAGRLVALIEVWPARSLERVQVTLTLLAEGGR